MAWRWLSFPVTVDLAFTVSFGQIRTQNPVTIIFFKIIYLSLFPHLKKIQEPGGSKWGLKTSYQDLYNQQAPRRVLSTQHSLILFDDA